MKQNNSGRGTGLVLILIAALIIAYLAVTQIKSLRSYNTSESQGTDLVQQAQDAVDAINNRQQGSGQM